MMIDLSIEEMLPLSKAARLYPGGGRHVSALHRYRQDRTTPLECLLVGGVWMTSVESMRRHVYALTEAEMGAAITPPSQSKATIQRRNAAEKTLAAAGI